MEVLTKPQKTSTENEDSSGRTGVQSVVDAFKKNRTTATPLILLTAKVQKFVPEDTAIV